MVLASFLRDAGNYLFDAGRKLGEIFSETLDEEEFGPPQRFYDEQRMLREEEELLLIFTAIGADF